MDQGVQWLEPARDEWWKPWNDRLRACPAVASEARRRRVGAGNVTSGELWGDSGGKLTTWRDSLRGARGETARPEGGPPGLGLPGR